jgi:hypothetical protein
LDLFFDGDLAAGAQILADKAIAGRRAKRQELSARRVSSPANKPLHRPKAFGIVDPATLF